MGLRRNVSMLLRHPQAIPPLISNVTRSITVHADYARSDGRAYNPKGISVNITKACNLDCAMCHYAFSQLGEVRINDPERTTDSMMSLQTVSRIVRGWVGRKPYVALTGGEPTLHPRLIEIVRAVKTENFACTLVTNGARLAEKAEALIESGIDMVAISIDGDEETHDGIRGVVGTYARAVGAARLLVEARDAAGRSRPLVFINSAISNDSVSCLDHLVELAREVGVNGINFQHLWLQTDEMVAEHNDRLAEYEMRDAYHLDIDAHIPDIGALVNKLEEVKVKHAFVNVFPKLTRDETRVYYTSPEQFVWDRPSRCSWLFATVQPDGRVTQCKEIEMGNVNEGGFQAVWNSKRFTDFRETIRASGRFPICKRCCQYFKEY